MMICKNEGSMDRVARISLGVVFIGVGIVLSGGWGIAMGVIGLIPLLTGIFGWCPLYALFKFSSCNTQGPTGSTAS